MGDVGNVGTGDASINYQYQVGGTDAAGKTAPTTAPPPQTQDSIGAAPADAGGALITPNPIDAPMLPPASLFTLDDKQLVAAANEWLNTISQSETFAGILDSARLMAAAALIEELFARDRSVAAFALAKLIGENIMEKAELEIQQHMATAIIGLASAAMAGLGALVSMGGAIGSAKAETTNSQAKDASKAYNRLADKEGVPDAQAASSPVNKTPVEEAKQKADDLHQNAENQTIRSRKAEISGRLMDSFSRSFETVATNILQAITKGQIAEKDQQKVLLEAILNIMKNSADSANQSARSFMDLINSTLQTANKWSDESARNFQIGR